jgi:uncharacterized Fe-S cluster-containing radical SAM superfamily protein
LNNHGELTRRGVIWLGQTCNLNCHFCYFLNRIKNRGHPEHPFMSLAKAKNICRTLVESYGNSAVDIQGGEPTIYPEILELVAYCRTIGLLPTLITNGLVLANRDRCLSLKEAGVHDFLVSVHGLGAIFDAIVRVAGAHDQQMQAIDNLIDTGIPFRFNCVLSKLALPQLTDIARFACDKGALAVNFISFNPFEDQRRGHRSDENVPRYKEVAPSLVAALDLLAVAEIEANVRYFPFCQLPERHWKSNYNFQQLPYDQHEWDYASWSWTGRRPQRMKDGALENVVTISEIVTPPLAVPHGFAVMAEKTRNLLSRNATLLRAAEAAARGLGRFRNLREPDSSGMSMTELEQQYRTHARIRARFHCKYRYAADCRHCSLREICDGFHGDYAEMFGTDEAAPVILSAPVHDPRTFIDVQVKFTGATGRQFTKGNPV